MASNRTFRTDRAAVADYFFVKHSSASVDDERERRPACQGSAPKRRVSTMLAAGLLVFLAGCSSSSDDKPPAQDPPEQPPPVQPPPPPKEPIEPVATEVGEPIGDAVTQAIGPAGGTIESADGALRIEVPAGALAAEQTLSIQPIANHAHGKVSGAFRLGPEDVPFASPVRLTFSFTPEQVLGTSPQLLRVASQNNDGFWELHEQLQLDAEEGIVSVESTHFSDWSLVTGALLSPESATIKPSETVSLSVVICERVQPDDLLAPLVAECRPSEVISNLVKNWSVNGTPGGDGNVGTVAVQDNRTALYTAPATAPQPGAVAVSTEYTTLQGELVLLISNIEVQSGVCTPPSPAEPCRFDLTEFNGEALPYEGLPRDSWENPEIVTSGRLSLWDFDGDGAGTWSLRIVWVEERPSGNLEQFEQLAGDFTSDSNGALSFTLLSGETFTGTIEGERVTLSGYPFSTQNVSAPADLKLRKN